MFCFGLASLASRLFGLRSRLWLSGLSLLGLRSWAFGCCLLGLSRLGPLPQRRPLLNGPRTAICNSPRAFFTPLKLGTLGGLHNKFPRAFGSLITLSQGFGSHIHSHGALGLLAALAQHTLQHLGPVGTLLPPATVLSLSQGGHHTFSHRGTTRRPPFFKQRPRKNTFWASLFSGRDETPLADTGLSQNFSPGAPPFSSKHGATSPSGAIPQENALAGHLLSTPHTFFSPPPGEEFFLHPTQITRRPPPKQEAFSSHDWGGRPPTLSCPPRPKLTRRVLHTPRPQLKNHTPRTTLRSFYYKKRAFPHLI